MAFDRLKVKEFKLRDPIDARQTDQAVQEINRVINRFPINKGNELPEGNLSASPGTVYSHASGRLFLKISGTSTTGWQEIGTRFYNQQSFTNGATINLGTAIVAMSDISTDTQFNFNISVPGAYKVEFRFMHRMIASVAGNPNLWQTIFRLTDGIDSSDSQEGTIVIDAEAGNVTQIRFPIFLSHIFEFATPGIKTIKLQRQVAGNTNLGTNDIVTDGLSNRRLVARIEQI